MEPAVSKKYCQISGKVVRTSKDQICHLLHHLHDEDQLKEHMKRGAHILAPGPAGVEGRFVKGIMLLLDGISVGGQSIREREGSPL